MADKTIPQLTEVTTLDGNALFPIDTGIQSFKIKMSNLVKAVLNLMFQDFTPKTTGFTVTAEHFFNVLPIDSSAGGFDIQLPDPTDYDGKIVAFKDVGNALSLNAVRVLPDGAEEIEGLNAPFLLEANGGFWRFLSSNGDWYRV